MARRATRPAGDAPEQSPLEFLRWIWATLTAMRTALWLLFALVIAAIPGSLGPKILPQRPTNPVLVSEFIARDPGLGGVLDRLGFFDVYGSPWFAAIYLLLMVSMVGCLIPRIRHYAKNVRSMPPGTPKRLSGLAAYTAGTSTLDADAALDAGEAYLVKRGYRVRRQGAELSGERGYLRELGNLLFHLAILGVLAGVLVSALFGYRGSVIVTEGSAFSNNLSQYDDFTSGAFFDADRLPAFTVWVDQFDVSFERGLTQRGAAREFRIHARVADPAQPTPSERVIEVNTPLTEGDSMVNLVGHGYAPLVTVKDAAGHVAYAGPVVFLPQDANFTSQGVIKAPDARPKTIGIEGYFVPSQSTASGTGPLSTFPDADNPMLWGAVWEGDPQPETGRPANIYSLDKTTMTQVVDGANPARFRLAPGEAYSIPGGGSVTFDGYKRWTKLQISSTPGLPIVLGSVALGVGGLLLSLFVRPRRLFARLTPDADAPNAQRVEVGGFDRADARSGLGEDAAGLASALGVPDARPAPSGDDATPDPHDDPRRHANSLED